MKMIHIKAVKQAAMRSQMRRGILALFLCGACALEAAGPTLKRAASIDLPGPTGQRFDYLTIDYEDHYLLSAHLGPGILYVIDMRANRLVKAILGVPEITGLEYVPGLRKVYTSDRGETKVGVVSLDQMRVVTRIPIGQKPNGSAYAEPFGKMYVSTYGDEEDVIDVRTDVVVKTLHFSEGTATPQYDSAGRKIYVNLHGADDVIAEIDPASDTIVGRYPVSGCHSGHGMALDAKGRRAFVLCNGNHVLDVFDLDAHKSIASFPIPTGADVVKFDSVLKRVYAACATGAIVVIQEDDPQHFRKLEDFAVEPQVHSLAVDVDTHRVYAPEQEEGGRPVSRMIVYDAIARP
jgi:DNA-binding beta-propeller fold protein YncE